MDAEWLHDECAAECGLLVTSMRVTCRPNDPLFKLLSVESDFFFRGIGVFFTGRG